MTLLRILCDKIYLRSWKPSASEKLQGQTIFSSDLSEISDNTCGKISPQTLEKRYRSLVKPYMLQGKSVSNKFSNDSIVSVHGISSDQCCRTLDVTLLVEMQYIEHLIKIAKSSIQYRVSCTKYIAESGFDPPTSGLWAQHASTAPLC